MEVGQYDVLYSIEVETIYSNTIYPVNSVQNESDAYIIQKKSILVPRMWSKMLFLQYDNLIGHIYLSKK